MQSSFKETKPGANFKKSFSITISNVLITSVINLDRHDPNQNNVSMGANHII